MAAKRQDGLATKREDGLVVAARVAGRAFVGLAILCWFVGRCCWRWFTGAPQRRRSYRGRRYVTRPVRAVGQSLLTAAVVGFAVAPFVTGVALAVVILTPLCAAAGYRIRKRLDDRRVEVEVGEPIRQPVIVDAEVVAVAPAERARTTQRLLRQMAGT